MHSMTGYGSGRSTSADDVPCAVEIQSVNRRQSEVVINLPRDLASLEPAVREIVNARVARGRTVVNVLPQPRPGANANTPAIDRAAARVYYQAMVALKDELGAGGEISIETVLRLPRWNARAPSCPDICQRLT